MEAVETAGVAPPFWIVVFNRETTIWWARWLAFGTYRHVRACAPVPELGLWLFYDVSFSGTRITLARNDAAERVWCDFTADADLIRMKPADRRARFARLGFWCVPAIKHLLGLHSGALRPDTLFRHCVAQGGEIIRGRLGSTPAIPAASD